MLYGTVFQYDNARPQVARLTTQFLANNVQTLPWPSLSPDLNPIEHTGEELDRRARGRVNASAKVRELFQEWVALPAQVIDNLFLSMPERGWALIDSPAGAPTDTRVPQSQNADPLNCFLDEKSVKIN